MDYERQGQNIGGIGFGLMGFTSFYGRPTPIDEAIPTMKAALEAGCNPWNAGEFYGTPDYNSMTLVRKYFETYPEDANKVIINWKGCAGKNFLPDGSAEGVTRSVDNILANLGSFNRIDQFEAARKDPNTPIETTMAAMNDLITAGKIGGVALSEVSAETIRRASKVAKILAVEQEMALWSTQCLSNGVATACAELGIPIIAYSPLGRGALAGMFQSPAELLDDDFRKTIPRFQSDTFEHNLKLVRAVEKMAEEKGCTSAQISIGWLVGLSKRPGMPKIIPIPGSTSIQRVRENTTLVELSDQDMARIEEILQAFPLARGEADRSWVELGGPRIESWGHNSEDIDLGVGRQNLSAINYSNLPPT